MIRFGTILTVVVVAMGLLVAGVLTGRLLLVYVAIGVAVLAALLLTIGVVIWRGDVFGGHPAAEHISQVPAAPGQVPVQAGAGSNLTGGPPPGREAGRPDGARRGGPPEWTVRPAARPEQDTRTLHLGPVEPAGRPGRAVPREQDTRTLRTPAAQDTRNLRPSPAEPAAGRPGRPGSAAQDTRTLRPAVQGQAVQRPSAPGPSAQGPSAQGPSAQGPSARGPAVQGPSAPGPAVPGPGGGGPAGRAAALAGAAAAGDQRDRSQPPDTSSGPSGQGAKPRQGAAAAGKEPAASAGPVPSATVMPAPAGQASTATPAAAPAAATGDGKRRDSGVQVTVVPGIARYHRSDCILIRFLSASDLETMALRDAEEAGCMPCKACRPEQELPPG